MKKFFIGLGVGILIIILLIVAVLFYVGIIPGFTKPLDLGAKNDPNFISTFSASHAMKNEIPGGIVPNGRQAEFSGQTNLNYDFTGNEITSILNSWKTRSPSLPIKNIQVRFNNDGTGEISGILEIKTAINTAKLLGYNDRDIETGQKYVQTFGDLTFYVKGTGGVKNNVISLNPTDFKIGNVTVPKDLTTQVAPVVSNAIEKRINQVGTIQIKSLDFSTGKLHIEGTVPDTVR
jgi:hypothetical protein